MIRDILFPVGKYHEDVFWTWQAVARAEKVSVFDTPCYYYLQRGGSIMGEGYSVKRMDAIEAKRQRLEFLEKNFPELAQQARKDLSFSCLYHGQLALMHLEDTEKRQAIDQLEDIFGRTPLVTKGLSVTHKCWLMLAKCSFEICCKVRNILGVGL